MRVVAEETGAGICLGGGAGAASGEFHITVCERGTYAIEKKKNCTNYKTVLQLLL